MKSFLTSAVCTAAAFVGGQKAFLLASSGAPAIRAPATELRISRGATPSVGFAAGVTPSAPAFGLANVAGCVAASLAFAGAARAVARGSRVARQFKKRYGGGPAVKEDPAAMEEYGPQYVGPRLGFQIQRKARLGMPKAGKNRCIPKLSGGSYERRKNMMRNLTTNLIRHGRIKTTLARATALGPFVDRMIVLAKRGDDLSRREANEWMYDESLVENLFSLARERYPDQWKDFTQVTRTMNRKGDWADMAYIELL